MKLLTPSFTGNHAYRALIPMDKAVSLLGYEMAKNSVMWDRPPWPRPHPADRAWHMHERRRISNQNEWQMGE